MERSKIKQLKYNEFDVILNGTEIIRKVPTLRGSVTIFPHEAQRNNETMRQTKLYYELAEESKEAKHESSGGAKKTPEEIEAYKEERKELFKIARTDMGIKFQNTISSEELKELIEKNKK